VPTCRAWELIDLQDLSRATARPSDSLTIVVPPVRVRVSPSGRIASNGGLRSSGRRADAPTARLRLAAIWPHQLAEGVQDGLARHPLGRVYAHAIRRLGYAGTSPVAALERSERPQDAAPKPRTVLTPEQVAAVMAHAAPLYRPALAFMAATGCRTCETLGLTWGDLDLGERTARIAMEADRDGPMNHRNFARRGVVAACKAAACPSSVRTRCATRTADTHAA
jgi:hypothetical protein